MRRALVVALVLSLAGCASNGSSGAGPTARIGSQVGELVPDFTLVSLDGETVRLSELKGQPVFLDFWATWCPPCRDSLPETARLRDKYAAAGLKVFAINVDEPPDRVREYLARTKVDVPVLMDSDHSVADSYRFQGLPCFFLLDRDHVVRWRLEGWGPAAPPQILYQLRALGIDGTN